MERRAKTWFDFGAMPTVAPSAKRVGVSTWAFAGCALGALAGCAALNLIWRPLPGLGGPPGALGAHAAMGLRWLIHQAWEPAFAREAAWYESALRGLSPSGQLALRWRAWAGALAACAPAALLARRMLRPRDGLTVLRGPTRLEGKEAAAALRKMLAKRCAARPDHDIAPGVPYPADMWTRHMLIVGSVGSGKSTALKPLIAKVVASGERALIFDPKGEFTKGFCRPGIVAPWDARSLAWDVAKDMRNVGDMRRFAAAMVRESSDPMWSNAARQLLVGFMAYLQATRGDDWGWRELAEMGAAPQAAILPIMEEHHPEAARAVERASVTTQGILINLASFMSPVNDLAQAWGDAPKSGRVSFVEWTHGRDKRAQIILQGHGAYPDLAKSCLEGIVGAVAAIVNSVEMDDDPSRKIWIIADESAQMGKVPIRTLFDVGRSRGVRCVIACQDLGQLEEIHGPQTVKALVSMAGTLLLGQLMPGETSEQICKVLGSREVERANVSASAGGSGSGRSTTLSFSRDELALYKPSELASRLGLTPDGRGVRMALCLAGNAYELFWPRFDMKNARPAHVPAPWTRRFALDPKPAQRAGYGVRGEAGASPSRLLQAPGDANARQAATPASPSGLSIKAAADSAKAGKTVEVGLMARLRADANSRTKVEFEAVGESWTKGDSGARDEAPATAAMLATHVALAGGGFPEQGFDPMSDMAASPTRELFGDERALSDGDAAELADLAANADELDDIGAPWPKSPSEGFDAAAGPRLEEIEAMLRNAAAMSTAPIWASGRSNISRPAVGGHAARGFKEPAWAARGGNAAAARHANDIDANDIDATDVDATDVDAADGDATDANVAGAGRDVEGLLGGDGPTP